MPRLRAIVPSFGPIGLAIAVSPALSLFGAAFAVAAVQASFSPIAAVAMSATTFAGSAQFAAATVLGQGGSPILAILSGIILNVRYIAMSVSVAAHFSGPLWRRAIQAQLLVDESWALAHGPVGFDLRLMLRIGIVMWAAWVGGTIIGLAAHVAIQEPAALGLDVAISTLLLGLLLPLIRERVPALVAAAGALIALVVFPIAPPGVAVVLAGVAGFLALRR